MPLSFGWPTQVDYQDALVDPGFCFADPDLQRRVVEERTPFGAPLPIAGQFTNVYRLVPPDHTAPSCAVRLFLRDGGEERIRRYKALTEHLLKLPDALPYMVPFEFLVEGIRIGEDWYPVVRMEWVEGMTLNHWVERHLYEVNRIALAAEQWKAMILALEGASLAHGDLQHGNVLVEETAGTFRLVDYDAAWVPALARSTSRELGHPSYQHPARSTKEGGTGHAQDRFPALVVYAALKALAAAPELWYRLDNGDNLLFRREDFIDPENSRAFLLLRTALLRSREAQRAVHALQQACLEDSIRTPPLDRL